MAVATTKVSLDDMRQHKEKLFSINLAFVHGIQSSENNVVSYCIFHYPSTNASSDIKHLKCHIETSSDIKHLKCH